MKTRTRRWQIRLHVLAGCLRTLLWGVTIVAAGCATPHASKQTGSVEDNSVEYKIKAAHLLTLAKFVEWPDSAFSESGSPIVLGVLGDDRFGGELGKAIESDSIAGRVLQIKHLKNADDLRACHILFISSSEEKRLGAILSRLKDAGVLTVGEVEQFTQLGGMINFIKVEDTVCLEVNLPAAERAGLKLSCKLLEVAKVVRQEPEATGR